jgi:hypothetical protein
MSIAQFRFVCAEESKTINRNVFCRPPVNQVSTYFFIDRFLSRKIVSLRAVLQIV